jgi:hypothetical protein
MVSSSAAVTNLPSRVNMMLFSISKIIPEMRQKVIERIGRAAWPN